MPVTTLHKLIGLSVALLGQAPGTDLLNQWTRLYTQSREDGMDAMAALQKVAQHILDSDAFAEVHPAYLIIDNQDFAQRFLNSVLGETASAEMVTLVVGLLNSGTSRAEVAVRAVEYLLEVNQQGSDHADYATFGTYAMRFGNQVEVARYYTVDKKWMTPGESVLDEVDDTAVSVTAAKGNIDGMQQPGKNFTLTTGVDQFTGTPGDDTFVATESTLNGADRLDGKEGMDTLELSSGSGANVNISIPRGATVDDIETLSVSSDGDFRGDVSKWTGLETVKLEVVKDVDLELDADAGIKVTSESLGNNDDASKVTIKNAGMVALEEVSKHAQVNIMGEGTTSVMVQGGKGVEVNSAASPSLTLKSVTLDGVHDGMGKDGKRYGTGDNKDSVPVHIYSKAIEDITVRNTNTTLLVQNDTKDENMTRLTAMVDRFGNTTGNGHGHLRLNGIEDLMLKVAGDSNIRLASDQIKQLAVSGDGDLLLNVTKLAPEVAESGSALKASMTLETLSLSNTGKFTMRGTSGLNKLKTIDASDATGDVDINNLGNSLMEYTGSAGKDMINVTAFNSKGLMVNLGDSDDTFTVNGTANSKSRIDGGAGRDTLVLNSVKNATYKDGGETKSIYTGFESVSLDVGGSTGVYDVKGIDLDKLMVTRAQAGVSGSVKGIGVTFKNVKPGTDLVIKSVATEENHFSTVIYELEETERFAANTTDHLNLIIQNAGHSSTSSANLVASDQAGGYREGAFKAIKPNIHLTLDTDIQSLTVNYTAEKGNSTADVARLATRFHSFVAQGLEEMKVISNSLVRWYVHATEGGMDTDKTTVKNLEYVDARESGGIQFEGLYSGKGVEIHGSDQYDAVMIISDNKKDTLMGYGGDDLLVGGTGADTINGGAGADEMIGGAYTLGASWVDITPSASDSDGDTFVYTMASDSQVNLDQMSGFDTIYNFNGGAADSTKADRDRSDKLDLRKVVDLQAAILTYTDNDSTADEQITDGKLQALDNDGKGDVYNGTLKDFLALEANKTLFKQAASTEEFGKKHSVVVVATKENDFDDKFGLRTGKADNKVVDWILIDVDGDGTFNAGTDMAIAFLGLEGDIGTGNFVT